MSSSIPPISFGAAFKQTRPSLAPRLQTAPHPLALVSKPNPSLSFSLNQPRQGVLLSGNSFFPEFLKQFVSLQEASRALRSNASMETPHWVYGLGGPLANVFFYPINRSLEVYASKPHLTSLNLFGTLTFSLQFSF
ncbi:MAG: hypothetical protein KDK66_00670 [Deltaproteobacteria bacterium]|nr:hypothetical protein [Deltaproteobacteria bacterium]